MHTQNSAELMAMEGDATPSCVGYYGQEFLVDRFFAFLNVLPIFFGLFVDFRGSGKAIPPTVCNSSARELDLYSKS